MQTGLLTNPNKIWPVPISRDGQENSSEARAHREPCSANGTIWTFEPTMVVGSTTQPRVPAQKTDWQTDRVFEAGDKKLCRIQICHTWVFVVFSIFTDYSFLYMIISMVLNYINHETTLLWIFVWWLPRLCATWYYLWWYSTTCDDIVLWHTSMHINIYRCCKFWY